MASRRCNQITRRRGGATARVANIITRRSDQMKQRQRNNGVIRQEWESSREGEDVSPRAQRAVKAEKARKA